ncbi:MAG: FMN-binding protein [Deltaproteobacteria bacterium]|nr:FMN-binding protein [Deltaproteobacteria bacterium]
MRAIISQKKIVDMELLKHFASLKGGKANEIIPQMIVAKESTAVDAVSGPTNSSRVIINAVQKALEKAYRE